MVKLVRNSEVSDEALETRSSDGSSQSSSFSKLLSCPNDSYQMQSSDSEEDESDAHSRTSRSVTTSVDTNDFHMDIDMDEEDIEEENSRVDVDNLDPLKDSKAAFGVNALKKRTVDTLNELNENQEEEEEKQPLRDQVVRPLSTFEGDRHLHAPFAVGVAVKKTRRLHRRGSGLTGMAPRFSTLSTGKQEAKKTAAEFLTRQNVVENERRASQGDGQTDRLVKTGAAVFGMESRDDTHMRSPSPKGIAAASFVPVDGGTFTLGQTGEKPKSYNYHNFGKSGNETDHCSAKVPTTTNDKEDGYTCNPSVQGKPASRGLFLFGQAYKNRKPHAFFRQRRNESLDSTASVFTPIIPTPTDVSGVFGGTKDSFGGTSSGNSGANSEPTAASTFFSIGVAGPKIQHQNSDHRRNMNSSSSTFAPISNSDSRRSQFFPASSFFRSSLFQSATATGQRPNTTFASGNAHDSSEPSHMASAVPEKSFTSTGGSRVFGNSIARTPPADSSSFQTGEVGSATSLAAPTTSSAGIPGQISRDEGTFRESFKFENAETKSPTKGANSHFGADNMSSTTIMGLQIGSSDAQRDPRVRPRRSGMFTHKNTSRKDAKLGANEPEPSPGCYSGSSSTPSPFGMHHRRTRKSARLKKCGRSPPTDPFATHSFQRHKSSLPPDGQLHFARAVNFTATTGFGSSIEATSTSSNCFGAGETTQEQDQSGDPGVFTCHPQQAKSSASQPQDPNHPSIFRHTGSSNSAKIQQPSKGGERPAFAGSRRILRAALRSVGVSGDCASSAPPTMGCRPDEGDAEMDSEDERDWMELKRLGGAAYYSKKYEDAAEYYRQSIELLESLPYHDIVMYKTEMRADKAKLHANRAASLMMLMQIAEAQRECRRSIEVDATYARAYLRLGRIQVLLGDVTNAQANMDTARQLMEGHAKELSSGDQADYASLTKMKATIKKLTILQVEIKWYVDRGDFKQALVQTNVALALAPFSRKLQVEKARILLHQKMFDPVIEFCTSIVEKQQASQGKMSSPASTSGVDTEPLKDKTVDKIAIVGIELGLLWATTLHYQNKVEDAVGVLDALEVVAPCSSHVIQLKRQWQDMKQLKHDGNERFRQGKYQEAVRFYSMAVQIDPQHQEYCAIIYCNRSAAQMGLEQYHTAIHDCNEALQRKPNYMRALLRRARCHDALKMYYEAVKDFERYLREQPSTVPLNVTADVRRERNEAKAAIAKAREEARQRETAKKRVERQQRQRHSYQWQDASWNGRKYHDSFWRGASNNNGSGRGSRRFQSPGARSRASYMGSKTERRTHYEVLGIGNTSTTGQIRKSYRKLALVYHPDKAKSSAHAELFKEMTAAYNVLSDESARAKYDQELISTKFF